MLKVYTLDEAEQWDRIVNGIASYEVFFLSDYLKAFQLEGRGEPLLVVYQSDREYAINAIFKRDIATDANFKGKLPVGKYYDISTPYGYGWFIGDIKEPGQLIKEWNEFCKNERFVAEFARFSLFSKYKEWFSGKVETRMQNVVRTLNMSLEEMYKEFKAKVRKNIKRANKYKLKIIIDEDGKFLEDFLRIYYSTMDRSHARNLYYFSKEYFRTIVSMHNSLLFHVAYTDDAANTTKIISTELVLYDNMNCYSYLGGTEEMYYPMRPNDFLKYEIIKWAKKRGLMRFVLGGGYGENDGIFQYKKAFAPNGMVNFYIGKKIWDLETYNYLCMQRGVDPEVVEFFPAYRS